MAHNKENKSRLVSRHTPEFKDLTKNHAGTFTGGNVSAFIRMCVIHFITNPNTFKGRLRQKLIFYTEKYKFPTAGEFMEEAIDRYVKERENKESL